MHDGTPGASPTDDAATATVVDPGLGDLPVFVDPTGGRHRRTRRLGIAVSVLCAGFVGAAALGITGTGPLSGSPVLTPVLKALDRLGVPHPGATPAETVAVSAPSGGPADAAQHSSSTGGGRATSVLGRVAGPTATPAPTPAATLPSPAATPTPTPAASSTARALPTTPGSDHRATPTPRSTSTSRGRPSPTPTSG